MNTFAVVLLAFPFYLAQKGRLAAYVDLAKPTGAQAPVSNTAKNNATTKPAPSGNNAQASTPGNFGLGDLTALPELFASASELFA